MFCVNQGEGANEFFLDLVLEWECAKGDFLCDYGGGLLAFCGGQGPLDSSRALHVGTLGEVLLQFQLSPRPAEQAKPPRLDGLCPRVRLV